MTMTQPARVPQPGDLIQVQSSFWAALQDGDWLRVCERPQWVTDERWLRVAPRWKVRTFRGPVTGLPDGRRPETMSSTGGPFRMLQVDDLSGLEYGGQGIDVFWCWRGSPEAGIVRDRPLKVGIWKCALLPDERARNILCVLGGKVSHDNVED